MNERNDAPDLTPTEQAGLARLPREREPESALEDRVVNRLMREGLLKPVRRPRFIPLRLAMAAGILLFLFGWLAGATLGGNDVTTDVREAQTNTSEPPSDIRMVFWL